MKRIKEKTFKIILIILGFIFVALGIMGLILPLMPGTVFFILAAACFVRSSEHLYNRLLENRHVGHHIRNYRENRAMPLKAKYIAISMMWLSILSSVLMTNASLIVKILLIVTAILVTTYIWSLKTMSD